MSRLNRSILGLKRGFGSVGPLACTWALTLLVLGLVILWLHISHEPAPTLSQPAHQPDTDALAIPVSTPPILASHTDGADGDGAYDENTEPKQATAALPSSSQAGLTDQSRDPDRETDMADKVAPSITAQIHLGPVPDPDLVEMSNHGPLPMIGADGKKPWHVYGRPYLGPTSGPKIALVIQEIGLSQKSSSLAIDQLPPEVTMAVSPYSANPQDIVTTARDKGHEVLLMVPMEPVAYPANDPGPHSLLVSLPAAENLDRLHLVMSRLQGYAGVVNHMGSRFTADRLALSPIISDIGSRGLLIVDARSGVRSIMATIATEEGFPVAVNDRFIDNRLSAADIDRYLSELEAIAHERGIAVGFGRPFPVTVDRIKAWESGLALRGVTLVPITAIGR